MGKKGEGGLETRLLILGNWGEQRLKNFFQYGSRNALHVLKLWYFFFLETQKANLKE